MEHQKNYHKTDLHARLIINIGLNFALLFNDNDYDISEYDTQAFMALFLKKNLKRTAFRTLRERFGKFDCAISLKERHYPAVLYELKTYIKPKESINKKSAIQDFTNDLLKLKLAISEKYAAEKKEDRIRGYFIVAAKTKDVKNDMIEGLPFITKRMEGDRSNIKLKYKGDKKGKIKPQVIKARPSVMRTIFDITVFSWEVLPANKLDYLDDAIIEIDDRS